MQVFAAVESMDYFKRGTETFYHLVGSRLGAGWGNNEGERYPANECFATKAALIESID